MLYQLSIIVPVYNVEKYICQCLDSVFVQIEDSVEIVIVNDGTSDSSGDIIKTQYSDWLMKEQVVLLEQENAGPGAARNNGLSVARGEYVGFLDSDDVLLENYFSILLDILSKYKTDIIEFGFKRFHGPSDIKKNRYQSLYTCKGLHELKEVRNQIFAAGIWFPSTRIYKKELFENIRFAEGVFYEDLMTIPHIYLKDLLVYFLGYPLIGYRFNPNSTTALHSESHAMDMSAFYMSLTELDRTIPIEILKTKTSACEKYFNGFSLYPANLINEPKFSFTIKALNSSLRGPSPRIRSLTSTVFINSFTDSIKSWNPFLLLSDPALIISGFDLSVIHKSSTLFDIF